MIYEEWQDLILIDSSNFVEKNISTFHIVTEMQSIEKKNISNTSHIITEMNNLLCNKKNKIITPWNEEWRTFCAKKFVRKSTQLILEMLDGGEDINIVQIGAHTGFEKNDPISVGLSKLLDEVFHRTNSVKAANMRDHFHWTFIEPSPPNFKSLSKNLKNNSAICDMRGVNAAVISDNLNYTTNMTFYSIRDTVNPETGFDSLSGKHLPYWITQLGAFDKSPILFNTIVFQRNGLDVNDYIVETSVKTKSYSKLMQEILLGKLLLVLIDTEGYDCDIIKGISTSSPYFPPYLLYEHKSCNYTEANRHLESVGYDIIKASRENTLAVKKMTSYM